MIFVGKTEDVSMVELLTLMILVGKTEDWVSLYGRDTIAYDLGWKDWGWES